MESSLVHESGMPVNSPVQASKPTWMVCSKFVGYEMLGLSLSLCLFPPLWPLCFFFSDSGSFGSGLMSTAITGSARVDVNLTGGAGGLSSSSDMVRGGGGCPNVLNLAVYAVIQITKQVLLVPHPPRLEIPLVFLRAIRVFASQPLNSPGHRLITKPTSISCCRFIPTHCQSGWL